MSTLPLVVTASAHIDVPAEFAFAFVADGMKQTHWALGSMERKLLDNGLFTGVSRWTYKPLYIRIESNKDLLLVDYFTGPEPKTESLRWGVSTRVIPGESQGMGKDRCIVAMSVWRTPTTTDEHWSRTQYVWPTEMALIKARSKL